MSVIRPLVVSLLCCRILEPACSQVLSFTSIPSGYTGDSIPLPRTFAGALAADPNDDLTIYASIGSFLDAELVRIDLASGAVTTVADGPFGNLAGIAVLSATQLALVDNASAPGGPPDRTILLAQDLNADRDFNDPGEIGELIEPILTGFFGWSGAQARVVPTGNASGIPSGSVLIQTADGGGEGDLLVVADPLGTPDFRPTGGAFFTGFDFNGGLDFDSAGNLLVGAANVIDPTFFVIVGNVLALEDVDQDESIGAGESNQVVSGEQLPNGIFDLIIDAEDDVFVTSGGEVLTFPAPAAPLLETATPSLFVGTNSFFLTGLMINSKLRQFEPSSGSNGATLVIGSGFGELNLLSLRPEITASVENWELYHE